MNTNTDNIASSQIRKVNAKLLFVIFTGMALSLVILYGSMLLQDATEESIMGRVVQSREALPQVVSEPQDLVMMYGSSMVGAGFSPRQFDRLAAEQGKSVKSFNYGFGGLNPFFQDYLSRRIRDEFEGSDKRLKLAIIEFNPFQATKTRWRRAEFAIDSFLTMLATDEELFEIARQDITRGIRMFTIKYLRAGISAEMVTGYYGMGLFPPQRPQRFEEDEEIAKKRREIGPELSKRFEQDYPDYNGEQWHYGWQGGGTIPEERSEETLDLFYQYYELQNTEARMKNARARRIMTADIEGLNFEPLMIESFIRTVENFKAISDNVKVVMLPRNTKYIQYAPDAEQRLADAVAQIEQATGLKIDNHQSLDVIDPAMFSDASHLNRYQGAVAYTDFLVREYSPLL